MTVKHQPDGYQTVIPYLIVPDVAALIEFTSRALGAEEVDRFPGPDGRVAHAEVKIGDSIVMMGGARPEYPPIPCALYVYVRDVDAVYKRALAAGATSVRPPADQFYGDRSGGVKDPFGNQWWFGTHIEDLSREEIARRAQSHAKGGAG